jgi:hypothetical protein
MTKTKAKRSVVQKKVSQPASLAKRTWVWIAGVRKKLQAKRDAFLERRPHRSFRRTRRRDYVRPLHIPGYWALTAEVWRIVWSKKGMFFLLGLLYIVLTATLVGLASQTTYDELSRSLTETGGDIFEGNWGALTKASLLLVSGVTGSLSDAPTDVQRIFASLLGLMAWLTVVWLLRVILSGKKPRLRDGLYNSGAPILPTFFVSLVLIVQLLPLAVALIAFSAAANSGLINEGAESMLFWTVAVLLGALSLYWLVSTFFALIVITLPGMYPMQALKIAGDLVVGRRLRIVLRFIWLAFLLFVIWAVTMIPLILFDTWLKSVWSQIVWLPLVPIALLVVATFSVIWVSAYTYIFYRKVVDDDAAPA